MGPLGSDPKDLRLDFDLVGGFLKRSRTLEIPQESAQGGISLDRVCYSDSLCADKQ